MPSQKIPSRSLPRCSKNPCEPCEKAFRTLRNDIESIWVLSATAAPPPIYNDMSSSLTVNGKARPRIENASDKLSEQVKLFNTQIAEHTNKQLENTFSNWESASIKPKLTKTDENYGHSDAEGKSHARAVKAKDHIEREVDELLDVIRLLAPDDGAVLFKDLFEIYSRISNKLVGIMIRARRSGYIDFEGEMMLQGRDDKKSVSITQAGNDRHRERSVLPQPLNAALLT